MRIGLLLNIVFSLKLDSSLILVSSSAEETKQRRVYHFVIRMK